jgi:two-component system sensor histidine kinase KdpD
MSGNSTSSEAKRLECSLTALLRLSDRFNSIFDLDGLLDALVEQAIELTDAESGCAGLRTASGLGTGWPGWVLTNGTFYLTNDALNDTVIAPEIRERFAVTSGMCIPILDSERSVIAYFEVYNKRSGAAFTQQDAENSLAAARIASLAIQNGILKRRVRRLRFLDELDRIHNALLAAISHEVRAPLAAITAAVTGILNAPVPLDRAHERQLLQTAEYEAKRLHRLMNNLLSVTRIQAGVSRVKLEPCDLSDVAGAALEELQTSMQNRPVSVEISLELPLVPMDFELIKQVLVNLFSNALKFSPADRPIRLGGQIVNGELEVIVADRGRGVPEEDLDRVFQKFHRLAESTPIDGLGLGLSICKEFVEAHRGRIRLEKNPGGGTIARFFLPVQATI